MKKLPTLSESLHREDNVDKGNFFLKIGSPCTKIGYLESGIMRGFHYDESGKEVTTHFYQEGDMIIGSFVPKTNMTMSIEALEDCTLSVADYSTIMSWVNKDLEITGIVNRTFKDLNDRLQSRLVSLLNLNSADRYALFLKEYPDLLNRIPHYYIAQYLGITPTQLSRARKAFINKCK